MKKFELKFYREWYDALSELSSEDRAAAALSLLEYAYEGIIPEDQFIRVVTTLMRNRIDREKSRSIRSQSYHSSKPCEEDDLTSSQANEEEKPTPAVESSSDKPNEKTVSSLPAEPSAENNGLSSQRNCQSNLQPVTSSVDFQIESVITSYYSSQSQSFLRICNKRDIDPSIVADRARIYLRKWIKDNPASPLPIPSRVIGTPLSPIDRFSVGLDAI